MYSTLKTMITGKRLVFCGTGNALHAIAQDLSGVNYTIAGLLDNNEKKHGSHLYGVEITPFHAINGIAYDYIVLATPFYADIIRQLTEMGVADSSLIRLGASYSFGCSIFETHAAQQQLRNENFTLISNDCWGGILYSWLGLRFQTPFINLIVPPHDYLALAGDPEYFLSRELIFRREKQNNSYPVGSLGEANIHFVHDNSQKEAKIKWDRRCRRINRNNIFFKFETDDAEAITSFDKLAAPRKIVFTRNPLAKGHSVIFLQDDLLEGPQLQRTCAVCLQQIDLIKWLNTGILHRPGCS